MDEEKPRSLGSIATRMVCTIFALLLLYLISAGPICYFQGRYADEVPLLGLYLVPAEWMAKNTALQPLLHPYMTCFFRKGNIDYVEEIFQRPSF